MAVGLHLGMVMTDLSRDFWCTTKPEELLDPKWAAKWLVGLLATGVDGKKIDVTGWTRCWDLDGRDVPP